MSTRIPTLCLLASTLLLAPACDEGPDSYDIELVEPGELETLASPIAQEQTDGTAAQQIAASPAFQVLMQGGWIRAGEVIAATAIQTPEEIDATLARMRECGDAYASGDPGFWADICPDEVAAAGFDVNLTSAEIEAAQQLQQTFGVEQLTDLQGFDLFRQAYTIHLANGGVLPSANNVPEVIAGVACDLTCRTRIRNEQIPGAVFGAWWVASTDPSELARLSEPEIPSEDGGDGGGGGGGGGGSIEAFIIKAAIEIAKELAEATIKCLLDPECNPWSNLHSECTEDAQCGEDAWCKKGFLGWGANECVPKVANGKSCSKDKECLSDCCNYNLFGSKCAVPSECN